MKKLLAVIGLFVVLADSLLLFGCSRSNTIAPREDLKSIEPVGEIPDGLKEAVENNLFNGVIAYEERLLKVEICSADKANKTVSYQVSMLDIYGKQLAVYTCSTDDAYRVTTLTATEDGGFLFVLGFEDYAYNQNEWASDKGFASRVIKCDKDGNLQFDTMFNGVERSALKYCFEKNGRFYLFGTRETPETQKTGVHSPTDIYMAVLDKEGKLLKNQCIAGSDYDSLEAAEESGDYFVLSVCSQSDDKDFSGSGSNGYPIDWVITVSDDLNITEKKKESGRDNSDCRIGEKDGETVYKSSPMLKNFDAGMPEVFIAYSDYYLIVSENRTGIYEKTPPMISMTWYYTETVYSAYDYNGKLVFRASVDSSPDYDAVAEKFYSQ